MKHKIFAVMMMLAGSSAWAMTLEARDPNPPGTPVELAVEHIYVPKGFDSNDHVEFVVEAWLPNLCYSAPKTEIRLVGREIRVKLTARYTNNMVYCVQAAVPVVETVSVGALGSGQYTIKVNNRATSRDQSTIMVTEALSPQIDDHVYANVDTVESKGHGKAVLRGYNPSDCFEFDHFETVSNGADTYSVLPIMKQVYPVCAMKMVPFELKLDLPTELNRDSVLLHVRRMDGKAVNYLDREP